MFVFYVTNPRYTKEVLTKGIFSIPSEYNHLKRTSQLELATWTTILEGLDLTHYTLSFIF